jgi:hypothetical protein
LIFAGRAAYDRVRRSGVLSRESICRLLRIEPERISDHVSFDPALAIKITISRSAPSGSPGDGDIFGSQQYGPLLDLEIAMHGSSIARRHASIGQSRRRLA